jgi:hypothetical protein
MYWQKWILGILYCGYENCDENAKVVKVAY